MSKNIEILKQRLEVSTSEQLFGIMEQPPQQCPTIDNIIRDLDSSCRQLQSLVKDLKSTSDVEDIHSLAGDVDWYSSNIDQSRELNNLRKQIELIRCWGSEWKDLAKSLLNSIKKEDEIAHYFSNDCQIKYDELQSNSCEV